MNDTRLLPSFGRRRGRKLRQGKQTLMETLLPRYRITLPPEAQATATLDPATFFPAATARLILEIGFGGGEHLASLAAQSPNAGCIGCEPYANGVASLLGHIESQHIQNIRIFMDDGRLLLERLAENSVDAAYILFPDPWPKARHHKRRIIAPPTVALLARAIKSGGVLRLATDHHEYAAWMLEHCLACKDFQWTANQPRDWKERPAAQTATRYEQKCLEGTPPVYLEFVRA